MFRLIALAVLTLLIIALFANQIVQQLRSGKFRPRGSKVDKTREDNPASYWSAIAVEAAMIILVLYLFSTNLLRAAK